MHRLPKAPPVFRPIAQKVQPKAPLELQRRTMSVAQPKSAATEKRPAPPVYRPAQTGTESILRTPVLQTKLQSGPPPAYKPQSLPFVPVQRHTVSGFKATASSIQRHPLAIKIEGYKTWSRDSGEINMDEDLALFQQKINDQNPKVTLIEVRKKPVGDHQVVVVGTSDGKYTQMDLSASGTMLRYNVQRDHYSVVVQSYAPKADLRLHDIFRQFHQATHARGYDFEDYNCIRFASDLAGPLHQKASETGIGENDWGW